MNIGLLDIKFSYIISYKETGYDGIVMTKESLACCRRMQERRFVIAQTNMRIPPFPAISIHHKFTTELFTIASYIYIIYKVIISALLKLIIIILELNKMGYFTTKSFTVSHQRLAVFLTGKLYLAKSFIPLEVFSELWGKENPCLMMVKIL